MIHEAYVWQRAWTPPVRQAVQAHAAEFHEVIALAAEVTWHDPTLPRVAHFAPKAKRIIYIYLEGGPSQMDLFDPKPELNRLHGQPLPPSMLENVSFAFIKKESARLMGTPRKFVRYGECGMEMSDLLPRIGACADDICLIRSMHTDQFNHLPGQLMMNCGSPIAFTN